MVDNHSLEIRNLILEAVEGGRRGHIPSAFSIVEILSILYGNVAKHYPNSPLHENRDRIILSKGHGCLALFAVLAHHGYFKKEMLKTFCKYDSLLGGHPEKGQLPGVEASTGSLGHGVAIGVGMAKAAQILGRNNKVFVIIGDGELAEGSIWESALAASQHKLSNLIIIVDYNKYQSYDLLEKIWNLEPLSQKWQAFGFECITIDGHNTSEIYEALIKKTIGIPRVIIANTTKGKGIDFLENNLDWHHKSNISDSEINDLKAGLLDA